MCLIRVPEGEVDEVRSEKNFWRNNVWNIPNLMKIINLEIKEAQLTKRARNMKKTSPIHVIIKLFRTDNKNILKVVREKTP